MGVVLVANGADTVAGTKGNDIFSPEDKTQYFVVGNYVLNGGPGDDLYRVGYLTKVVEKPDEGVDIIQTDREYKLPDNVEGLWFGGSAGFGNDMGNTLVGTTSNQLVNGGKGDDMLFGGGGSDVYQFDAQSGRDTIGDWNAQSVIRFGGYSQFHTLSDVTAAMTQVGSDVVLRLDADNDVTIKNAKITDFTASNFQYRIDMSKLHLSFDDEFNNLSVKQASQGKNGVWSLWGHDTDVLSGHTLQNNGEKQLYVDPLFKGTGNQALGLNPYSVQDGVLNITASPIAADKQAAAYNYQFQSGAISSDQTFSQTYGYFEARMQLPAEKGTWPAFWLMRKDGVWPPELDIMEAWNDTTAYQTLHTQQNGYHQSSGSGTWLPGGDTAFHDYGFLWTAEKLTWYLDGVEVFSQPTPADMNSPMYMIVNLAVSGQVQDPNFNETLKVDYVRAYSLENLPAGVAPVSPDPTIAVPATADASPYYGAIQGMPDGLNSAYYLAHNPDVAAAFGNDALTHYVNYGRAEGRLPYDATATTPTPVVTPVPAPAPDPVPVVDTPVPVTPQPETVPQPETSTDTHPFWGRNNTVQDGFNADYYAAHNPDVVAVFGNNADSLLYHYETYGKKEGRAAYEVVETTPVVTPTPTTDTHAFWGKSDGIKDGFNADYYAAHNPDVVAVFGNNADSLLYHYETYGKKEGRPAYDPTDLATATHHGYWGSVATVQDGFNSNYYASHNPDVVAVFGNDANSLLYHYETYGKTEGRAGYEQPQASAAIASQSASASPVDVQDVPASTAFHTEVHAIEPLTLIGVAPADQHYGLAA